ncbi:hypothetical protein JCM14469_40490 [Desulfatiferula olefinivorans]
MLLMVMFLGLMVAACGQVENETDDDAPGLHGTSFQDNGSDTAYPEFVLTEIFTGRGGLEEMWDSIDAKGFNRRFTDTVNSHIDDFIVFSDLGAVLIDDPSRTLIEMVSGDGAALLDALIDPEPNYPLRDAENAEGHVFSGEDDMNGFYAFLDRVFDDSEDSGSRRMTAVARGLVGRMVDRMTPEKIHEDMEELIDDIQDDDFAKDFVDVTTALGKLLVRADFPQTDDQGDSLDLGNAVRGMIDLITWYDRMVSDPESRRFLRTHITELASVFDAEADTDHHARIRKLLVNLEDQFTAGGEAFQARPDLNRTNDDEIYSDTELGRTVRELFPGMLQLLMRSDRPHALIANAEGETPVYLLKAMVDNLRALGYDPATADMETTLTNLMRYDMLGRDRMDPDSGAFSASHLESLLFLTHVTANVGWQDRDNPAGSVVPDPEVVNISDARYRHGHGAFTGRLSLNDSLFSIRTHKTLNSLGLFDIGLKPDDGESLHRSRVPFSADVRDQYRFYFDQNYDVLQCLAPPCVGDLGAPDGGNPDGRVFGGEDINAFRAYSPDGLDENQLAAWTLGLVVRACFNGEGPYYYDDPAADEVIDAVDGRLWRVYRRPNGKIYAWVSTDDPEHPEYVYPADEGDPLDGDAPEAAGTAQRYNRYKAAWQTDYYLSCFTERYEEGGDILERPACRVPDNSSGRLALVEVSAADGAAGRLTYGEAVAEADPRRACQSPEEALFRNYQWLMEEKKMVIIIPLKLDLGGPQAVVYQVLEANGITGICNLRKYRGNHYWAKAGTDGTSSLPGDYRIEVVSSATGADNVLSALNIYGTTLDCGHATPAVVGMNIQALTRLGFPRYTGQTERGDGIVDSELGSGEFARGDAVWQERSALLPPFVALISALRAHTPPHGSGNNPLKKGIHSFVEGTSALLKPLIYYQKDSGAWPHKTWKPRVAGSAVPGPSPAWDDYLGDDFLRSTADFNNAANRRALHWNGTKAERLHFQPAAMKNLLNVLIDSDIGAAAGGGSFAQSRLDGILPLLAANRSVTTLLEALMSEANDADLLYAALEQLVSVLKITKGPMTTFNETNVKNIDFPAWIFVQGEGLGPYNEFATFSGMRDEDLVLDRAIDRLVGHDRIDETRDGYGLSCYVDEQEAAGWEDLEDVLGLLDDLLPAVSPYSVVDAVLDMNEAVFGRDRLYEASEIRGLVYALGKLVTRYDSVSDTWISQGRPGFDDLFRIIRVRLPEIHRLIKDDSGYSGDRYHAVLELNRDMLKEDGAAEFLVTTMGTRANWEDLLSDASAFLKDEWVTEDAPMWSSFVDLLRDLAVAVEASKDGSLIESIYEKYGFQQN